MKTLMCQSFHGDEDIRQLMYNSLNRNCIMFLRQGDKSSIGTNETKDQHEVRIVDKMHDPDKGEKIIIMN